MTNTFKERVTGTSKRITINVTQELIDQGGHGAHHCPVQKAVQPLLVKHSDSGPSCGVTQQDIRFYLKDDSLVKRRLPERVTNWIYRYDDGQNVEPISFELEVPECLLKSM